MSSGEVLSKLQAENGKPSADVWFGGGLDSFITAKNKGLLEQYISPEMKEVPLKYRDKDGYWSGVSLVLVGFMVNNAIRAYLLKKEIQVSIDLKFIIAWAIVYIGVSYIYLHANAIINVLTVFVGGLLTLFVFRKELKEILGTIKNR